MKNILNRLSRFYRGLKLCSNAIGRIAKRISSSLRPLLSKFTRLPNNVPAQNYRFFVLSNYCYFFATIGHATGILLTELVGARNLTFFNFGSVILYLVILRLNLWGFLKVSLPFVIIEGLTFVSFVSYTVGNIGISALLIPLAMFVFFSPLRYRFAKVFISIIIGAIYAALNYYVQTFTPSIVLSPFIMKILNFVTSCVTLGTACFLGYYYQIAAVRAEAGLEQEYERAETLLHNILPETIANRLKLNPETIADGFEGTTILFADIVEFTPLAEEMSPENMVMLLNQIFSEFDDLVDKYGLEKIKTIGDAYMVVAGLPEVRNDHAEAVADMALDIIQVIAKFERNIDRPLQVRIGISSGPAVAGVIGKKKFIYDLWGDTVNTASRMESHGIPGEIQITQTTYNLLKDRYRFEDRGVINVKGKGPMQTYLLKGKNLLA